jgi:hypothetical protein
MAGDLESGFVVSCFATCSCVRVGGISGLGPGAVRVTCQPQVVHPAFVCAAPARMSLASRNRDDNLPLCINFDSVQAGKPAAWTCFRTRLMRQHGWARVLWRISERWM